MRQTFGGFAFDIATPRSRAERVARIDALATLLDTAFVVPGTNIRFGIDALIGLVPGIGDTITTLMSLYIVREAHALGIPRRTVARMLVNVALDGIVGAVPLVGDAFDVAWRANRRNIAILREHLAREERAGAIELVRAGDASIPHFRICRAVLYLSCPATNERR